MSSALKIIMPNFKNSGEEDGRYEVKALYNDTIVGKYSIFPFNRYDIIEETEYGHEDFCFFSRRLELYHRPYLNSKGVIIMVISDFEFNPALDADYKLAFLRNSLKRIVEKVYDVIADIYILVNERDLEICKAAGFELTDVDHIYGYWMHYTVNN